MIVVMLVVLGLCLGSFVNAMVWRLHEQESSKKKAKDPALSIIKGRSMCPDCHHELSPNDLIPLFSWLALKGRCRYCHKPISAQYPLVEALTAVLFVVSYIFWPYDLGSFLQGVNVALWMIILVGMVAMAVYDLKWMILPNKLVYIFTGISIIFVALQAYAANDTGVVTGALLGLVAVGGLFYTLFQISNGKWIGGGDVKLGFMIGLLAGGFMKGLLLIFLASLIGTVFALPLLLSNKKSLTQKLPFGPFLLGATLIVYLFGQTIIDWYQALFVV